MPVYPSDTHYFYQSIIKADGSAPSVTSVPLITIISASTGTAAVTAVAMTLVAGTQALYKYGWNTAGVLDGDYFSITSYAADAITVTGRFLERIRVGDSRITATVAQDATVAKAATVAQDATVAHASDLVAVNPNNSSVVLAIKAKTDNLPADPASLAGLTTIASNVADIRDAVLGTWSINKTVNPQVLTLKRLDGTTIFTYNLTDDVSSSTRTKFP